MGHVLIDALRGESATRIRSKTLLLHIECQHYWLPLPEGYTVCRAALAAISGVNIAREHHGLRVIKIIPEAKVLQWRLSSHVLHSGHAKRRKNPL
jgi:hypothetical protein